MSRAVVCVGDVMTDVVAHLPGPLAVGSDTPAAVRLTGGGSAANTASWLAYAGMDVALVGRVGDDTAGRAAVDDLRRHGVTPLVEVDPDRPTGCCLVLVEPSGERTMVPDAGANAQLRAVPALGDAHLHVSAYSLFHPAVRPVVLAAMRTATSRSIDVASAALLAQVEIDVVRPWCTAATVFANAEEATLLTGQSEPAAAARLLATWGSAAVVKCGADGAIHAAAGVVTRVPVPDRVHPVDSTGAGDAFAAGYLAAVLSEHPDWRPAAADRTFAAMRRGHTLAAQAVGQVGARPPFRSG